MDLCMDRGTFLIAGAKFLRNLKRMNFDSVIEGFCLILEETKSGGGNESTVVREGGIVTCG